LYLFFYHQNINLILMSFWVLVYFFAVLKATKYLFLFFPFFLLIPAYVYYISIYHVGINEQILSIVVETDIQEARQFLGGELHVYLIVYLFWFVWCLWCCYKHYKSPVIWRHWSRYLILVLGTVYFSLGYYLNAKIASEMNSTFGHLENNFLVQEENGF